MRSARRSLGAVAAATAALLALASPLVAWGAKGHWLTGRAAASALPTAMPAFFREAGAQLAYLNPEPDRWRQRAEDARDMALAESSVHDHYIDLEMIPAEHLAGALGAAGRYAYIDTLHALGIDAAEVGFLPFRIVELSQRLRVEFRLWRGARDEQTRRWIEARIVNDAGILGHYVADGSNPAHTTIHFNGWIGENPKGYATDRAFHSRFESAYVEAQMTLGAVQPLVDSTARVLPDVRAAVLAYLQRTHGEVEHLYALDRQAPFGRETTSPEDARFTAERLAAGATMLRDLWWTAWVTSAADSTAVPVRK